MDDKITMRDDDASVGGPGLAQDDAAPATEDEPIVDQPAPDTQQPFNPRGANFDCMLGFQATAEGLSITTIFTTAEPDPHNQGHFFVQWFDRNSAWMMELAAREFRLQSQVDGFEERFKLRLVDTEGAPLV